MVPERPKAQFQAFISDRQNWKSSKRIIGDIANELLVGRRIACSGRQQVTAQDVAIFLMIGRFFSVNMNSDGSMPYKRWKEMWTSLYQAGDIQRAFDSKRFSAIRNFISSLGLIEWNNNIYRIGTLENKGEACKWQFSAVLMDILSTEEREHPWQEQAIHNLGQLPFSETIRPVQHIRMPFFLDHDEVERRLAQYFALSA